MVHDLPREWLGVIHTTVGLTPEPPSWDKTQHSLDLQAPLFGFKFQLHH